MVRWPPTNVVGRTSIPRRLLRIRCVLVRCKQCSRWILFTHRSAINRCNNAHRTVLFCNLHSTTSRSIYIVVRVNSSLASIMRMLCHNMLCGWNVSACLQVLDACPTLCRIRFFTSTSFHNSSRNIRLEIAPSEQTNEKEKAQRKKENAREIR